MTNRNDTGQPDTLGIDGFNEQVVNNALSGNDGGEDVPVDIIDVQPVETSAAPKERFSRKKKILIAAVLVGSGVVGAAYMKQHNVKVLSNPKLDAILASPAPATPIATLPASAVPPVDVAASSAVMAESAVPDAVTQGASMPSPTPEALQADVNGVHVEPLDKKPSQPVVIPKPSETEQLRAELEKAKADLQRAAADAERERRLSANLKRKLTEKPAQPVKASEPKKVERTISMRESGIEALTTGSLFITQGGGIVEHPVGDVVSQYGKLLKVNPESRSFETSTGIYILKD